MNRYVINHLSCVLVLLFSIITISCTTKQEKFVSNLNCFVTDVESNADQFTQSDWEALDQEIAQYIEDYQAISKEFTREQQVEIGRLSAKYTKVRAKAFMNLLNNYSGLVEGFVSELDEEGESDADENDMSEENFDSQNYQETY